MKMKLIGTKNFIKKFNIFVKRFIALKAVKCYVRIKHTKMNRLETQTFVLISNFIETQAKYFITLVNTISDQT